MSSRAPWTCVWSETASFQGARRHRQVLTGGEIQRAELGTFTQARSRLRLVREAGFSRPKRIEDFDYSANPNISAEQVNTPPHRAGLTMRTAPPAQRADHDRLGPRVQPGHRLPPGQYRAGHRPPEELETAGHRLPGPA